MLPSKTSETLQKIKNKVVIHYQLSNYLIMKKTFLFVATLLLAVSLVGCKNGQQAQQGNSEVKEQQTDANAAIKKKAEYIVREAAKASASGDWGKLEQIAAEEQAFVEGMTEQEIKIYNETCIDIAAQLTKEYL